jgi:hypothetical protein
MLVLVALVGAAVAAPAPRWPKFVARVTIDCAYGRDATIAARGDAIAIVGECATVVIAGNANVVSIASAHKLVVTGSRNVVIDAPVLDTIDVRGDDNIVSSCQVGTRTIGVARGCARTIRNTGANNTIYSGNQVVIQLQ